MDAQRALLDELMGRNRDGDRPEEDIDDFRDRRVCKRFLCGLCPHDLFQNTKMDLGDCAQLHLPKLREQYERARLAQRERDAFGYDAELERHLVQFVADVEKRIQRAQRRLEEQDGAKAPVLMDFENSAEVLEVTAEIRETLRQAEQAGNEGEVDRSMELMGKVEELTHKRATAQANAMLSTFRSETSGAATGSSHSHSRDGEPQTASDGEHDTQADSNSNSSTGRTAFAASGDAIQKLRVCDVCGAFLSIFDSDRRLADHFGGKLHLGYLQIRRKINELADARRDRRRQRSGGGSVGIAAAGERDKLSPPKAQLRTDAMVERRRDARSKSRSRPRSSRDDRARRPRGRSHDRERTSSRRRRRSASASRSRSRSRSRRQRH